MDGADYTYYATVYGGTAIPAEQFDACARRAGEALDADTFGRAGRCDGAWADAVRRCRCALAELDYAGRDGRDAVIRQEKLGSWSRTYARGAQDTPAARRRAIEERYLAGSGLLYRGRRTDA